MMGEKTLGMILGLKLMLRWTWTNPMLLRGTTTCARSTSLVFSRYIPAYVYQLNEKWQHTNDVSTSLFMCRTAALRPTQSRVGHSQDASAYMHESELSKRVGDWQVCVQLCHGPVCVSSPVKCEGHGLLVVFLFVTGGLAEHSSSIILSSITSMLPHPSFGVIRIAWRQFWSSRKHDRCNTHTHTQYTDTWFRFFKMLYYSLPQTAFRVIRVGVSCDAPLL